ncbi:unnamed protein product [Lasius platythorax]|uniref:Uncharacterized protein n=1 Tax=Lasius platythorax TaxID=488582 RepID=A0AAV2NB35_9HYME
MGARSEFNNDILGKIFAESLISITTRTHARIDRSLLFRCLEKQWRKNRRNFVSRKLLTRSSRGQRFKPTRLPSFIEMSGLRLPFGRVVTSKTKGKSVALDTLPDPRIPNEDL